MSLKSRLNKIEHKITGKASIDLIEMLKQAREKQLKGRFAGTEEVEHKIIQKTSVNCLELSEILIKARGRISRLTETEEIESGTKR